MTEYYNPKDEPGIEKRLLVVFALVFIGILMLQYLGPKAPPQPQQKPETREQQQKPEMAPVAQTPAAKVPKSKPVVPAVSKTAQAETESIIDNDLYRIKFVNRGAQVKSWVLKKFKNDKHEDLDIVNPFTARAVGYPLSLFTYDPELQKKLNEALYVPSVTGNQGAPASLTFEYADADLQVRKKIEFDKSTYVVRVEIEVVSKGVNVQAFPQWPGGFGDQTALSSYGGGTLDWQQDDSINHTKAQSGFLFSKKWVPNGDTVKGPFQWVATADQYFAAVFMPDAPKDSVLITLHNTVELPHNLEKPDDAAKDKVSVLGMAVGARSGLTRTRLFVGPKVVEVLEGTHAQANGPDLRGLLDFGMFSLISRPLFLWLKWTFVHMIHNWGWAIAFLTLVISAVLLPLRISGIKSSLKMQKIQPQMKAINEKYKRFGLTDPRQAEKQKEMSELYKREGVNPVGGCFPMLLQMPFLFAFYSMLGNAVELRQAPWLWISDLSSPDPLHILPIGIVITMFLTQKSTPQAGMDPAQQKMMQVMTPVMLGVISWNLAAGLGVYWAISNVVQYVQQAVMNRTAFGKQVRKTVERRAQRKK
ncbi:MAG TPA: membrane protein insertase YidC [Candidatus Saccharimonadales bacterium]|nr:membrane protein insertase YidC [Candidatus Saccharimonadales bacterium]